MDRVIFSSWAGKVVDNRKLGDGARTPVGELNLPVERDLSKVKAFMAWDGFVVMDEDASVVDMAYAYAREIQKLACGECSVGRIGIAVIVGVLGRLLKGEGREGDIELLQWVSKGMMNNAKCVLGQTAPVPILDSIEHYREAYLDLIQNKKAVSPALYQVKVAAPCMEACPAHLDIPGYIELIRNQDQGASLELIRQGVCLPGTLGRVCPAPCEEACKRNDIDGPLGIRALKRYVADWEMGVGQIPPVSVSNENKEKVAIVGAGPAGLAAGYNLALVGYGVTIFEEMPMAGGMAAVGIPSYRLPKAVLGREVDIIKGQGVDIRFNVRVGHDITIADLWKDGYKAVFLAVGAHKGRAMGVEGEEVGYDGFVDGVKFLRDVNLDRRISPVERVVVIGGGDVAVDCARSCLRLGFKEVNILYRRSRAEMPARDGEIEAALEEGVKISYLVAPKKILAEGSRLVGLECVKMELGEPDSSGRRRPVPIDNSEFTMDTDMVIAAIGQKADLSCLAGEDGVKVSKYGTVDVDLATYQSSEKRIFSAGDCVTGPAVLIEAVEAGNRAARSIDRYLKGEGQELHDVDAGGIRVGQNGGLSAQRGAVSAVNVEAQIPKSMSVDERMPGFPEVEECLTREAAQKEASRCLRCYRVMLWQEGE
jgi:formate dehydrogenase (NADP+) beta subunit